MVHFFIEKECLNNEISYYSYFLFNQPYTWLSAISSTPWGEESQINLGINALYDKVGHTRPT